jgi:TfoX/Sxy family transcriptional regulator of competence genes
VITATRTAWASSTSQVLEPAISPRHTARVAYDQDLADRLRDLLAAEPSLTEKRMFGGVAFLLDGHMAVAASSRGGIMVRVDPAREDALLDRPGVEPMIMRGRPMTGWLRVAVDATDTDALRGWVDEGVSYVRTLPPK